MARSEWSFATATELSAALAAKKVSAVELAQDAIGRIERHDGKINAICVRDFERGLDAARAADAELARGETKPLLGIPLTVKESYNVAGLPTTWGFPAQKDFVPGEDALSISRVRAAGGVILGDRIGGELVVADDTGEEIVEIVRDAAGERAQGVHLLRLEELALEFAAGAFALMAGGDVLQRSAQRDGAALAEFGATDHAHPPGAASRGNVGQLKVEARCGDGAAI